jgi:hypothetical protein
MTALAATIFSAILILGAGVYVVVWTVDNVKSELIKTVALIIYGLCFVVIIFTVITEAFTSVL